MLYRLPPLGTMHHLGRIGVNLIVFPLNFAVKTEAVTATLNAGFSSIMTPSATLSSLQHAGMTDIRSG